MKIINFRFWNMLVSVYRLKVVYEGKLPIFSDILHCEVMTWVSAEALSPFLMLMAALLWEATRLWFLQFFIVWTKAGVVSADAQSWGNISEPIKCCRPSMAALRMCMSPRGKAHICLYIFMCVCVCWWVCERPSSPQPLMLTAFSCLLWNRGDGGIL